MKRSLVRLLIKLCFAIPFSLFGQDSVRVIKISDLNGDGISDTITLSFIDERGPLDYNLRINNVEITSYATNILPIFNIVNIDTNDKFKEIAIYEEGPSSDEATTFYFFNGKHIILTGV